MTQALASASDPTHRELRDRALFDGIAEAYTRKDLHAAASIARRQRLRRTLAAAVLPDRPTILEAGCGAGFSSRYLQGEYGQFLGIDYASNLIDAARQYNDLPDARFATANIKELEYENQFDAIVMIGVLHHLDDMPAAVGQLVRALKPGGWLLANEPQPANPVIRLARAARKRVDSGYSDEQDQLSGKTLCELYCGAGLVEVDAMPQGLFSTPLAEVPLGPVCITAPLTRLLCGVDTVLERTLGRCLKTVSWNLIARGRKPR